jgi:hypothetical protein
MGAEIFQVLADVIRVLKAVAPSDEHQATLDRAMAALRHVSPIDL